ncbi:hypothetical protein OH764_23295 [Burkholderia sp. M6-3]
MIAFAIGETEQALLQNRVVPVPKREREAEPLLIITQSAESVLAPSVRA